MRKGGAGMNAPQTLLIPDYSEQLQEIIHRQETTERLLMQVLAVSGQRMVWKISDIAAFYGKSYDTLRTTDRYLLPRFGESAFPTGAARPFRTRTRARKKTRSLKNSTKKVNKR